MIDGTYTYEGDELAQAWGFCVMHIVNQHSARKFPWLDREVWHRLGELIYEVTFALGYDYEDNPTPRNVWKPLFHDGMYTPSDWEYMQDKDTVDAGIGEIVDIWSEMEFGDNYMSGENAHGMIHSVDVTDDLFQQLEIVCDILGLAVDW